VNAGYTIYLKYFEMSSEIGNILLPGQPIFGLKPPTQQGNGTYSRDGVVRASLFGEVDMTVIQLLLFVRTNRNMLYTDTID
jgi:exosome complex RNA-binding protein Csl4